MAERAQEWLKPEHVEWLKVSQLKLGEGHYGEVFAGRLKFKGRKPFAVAVKRFRFPSQVGLRRYEQVISDMRAAGVRMPKMAFLTHERQPVLVSEVFKEGGRSKLRGFGAHGMDRITLEEKNELLDLFAKVMNAGYAPPWDSVGFVSSRNAMKPIVFDVDLLAESKGYADAHGVRQWVKHLFSQIEQRHALRRLLEKVSHPAYRKVLQETEL